jgi:hypothetical protein
MGSPYALGARVFCCHRTVAFVHKLRRTFAARAAASRVPGIALRRDTRHRAVTMIRNGDIGAVLHAGAALALAAALLLPSSADAQREFRVYPSFEGEAAEAPLPPDYQVPGELVIGRLMYGDVGFGFGGEWRQGGTGWTDDYPRGDRTLVQMLRRFTRTSVRAVEQPVNLEDAGDSYY